MGYAQINGQMTKVNPLSDVQGHSLLMVVRRLTNVVTGSDVGIPHPMDQGTTPTVEAMNGIKSQQDHPVVLFAVNQDIVLDTTLTVGDHLDRISPHVLFVSS